MKTINNIQFSWIIFLSIGIRFSSINIDAYHLSWPRSQQVYKISHPGSASNEYVLPSAKVQLIKISAIFKNLDFWSNLVLHCTKLCTCIIGSKSQTTNSQKSPTPPWNKSHLYIITMTKKEVLKVLDNIFVAINYGLANCIMIEADL